MFYTIGSHKSGFQGLLMRNINNSIVKYFAGENIAYSSTSMNNNKFHSNTGNS